MFQHQEKYVAYIKAKGVGSNDKVEDSRQSYVSYLNSVQKHLGITINEQTLSTKNDIHNISKRLAGLNRLSDKTIKNYGSAMNHYVEMVASFPK